jgi:hypothetical protein
MLLRMMVYVSAFVFLTTLRLVCADSQNAEVVQNNPVAATDTSVCELAASPAKFDGKLLRIHTYMSRGFEDSTLHDPECAEEALVNWQSSGTPKVLIWSDFANEVGNYKVKRFAPLVNDEQLKEFHRFLREQGSTRQLTGATLIGTFYAEKSITVNGHTSKQGYGHMGCCSLFVISRVESVDKEYGDDLSYSATDWYIGLSRGCVSEQMLRVPTNETLLAWQQAANQGQAEWHHDARQTAEEELKELKFGTLGKVSGGVTEVLAPGKSGWVADAESPPTETLLETEARPFRKRYEWIEGDRITKYVIVVTRPYWLLKAAGTSEKVIWVPAGASMLKCGVIPAQKKKKH